MSLLSYRQAKAFLSPLQQKVTVFAVDNRPSHLLLTQFFIKCICLTNKKAVVLDTDAIYASNCSSLASKQTQDCLENFTLRIPKHENIRTALIDSIFTRHDFFILDDLNSVYHLVSRDDRSAVRELTAVTKTLSYICKENGTAAFLTTHSTGATLKKETGPRSLFRMGDLSISTDINESVIQFTCKYGRAWPDSTFSASL